MIEQDLVWLLEVEFGADALNVIPIAKVCLLTKTVLYESAGGHTLHDRRPPAMPSRLLNCTWAL
jgi:hypothetical protein